MKEFLKFTLATVVGIILTGVVFFLLSIVVITGIIAGAETETKVPTDAVFHLYLNGVVEERVEQNPIGEFFGAKGTTIGLEDVVKSIKKAKDHEDIKGIYIEAGNMTASYASLQAIRRELVAFKKTGKFIIAYGGNYSQNAYYLASVADKVYLNPMGNIAWHGLATEIFFAKDLLKKVGIQMQVFKVGTYKSAVEPFTETQMSEANREQNTVLLQSIWQQVLADVSTARNLPKDTLNAYADQNLDYASAKTYVEKGLADQLLYQDQVLEELKKQVDIEEDETLHTLTLNEMIHVGGSNTPKGKHGNLIAVYYATGSITDAPSPNAYETGGINAEDMTLDLRRLREDENIHAVVLRINSPGGSAYASEQIWREIELLKKKKPVIVSMGDVAASGGYYIACGANKIFAESTTITGSIGVFGMIPDGSELLTEKLDIHFDQVKTNTLSDMGTMSRPMNEAERALIQRSIEDVYGLFTKRCADGRKLPIEKILEVAEGRVWSGAKAKELGLVDQIGGLDDAIAAAAKAAKIEEYTLVSSPALKTPFATFFDQEKERYISSEVASYLGEYAPQFFYLKELKNANRIQARMPFFITFR